MRHGQADDLRWQGRRLCRDRRPLIAGLIAGALLSLTALLAA